MRRRRRVTSDRLFRVTGLLVVRAELVRRGRLPSGAGRGRAEGGPRPSSSGLSRVPSTRGVCCVRSFLRGFLFSARVRQLLVGCVFSLALRSNLEPPPTLIMADCAGVRPRLQCVWRGLVASGVAGFQTRVKIVERAEGRVTLCGLRSPSFVW